MTIRYYGWRKLNFFILNENIWGPFYWQTSTLISAWISNYIQYQVWDEVTYPFPNFNGEAVEVWEWISNSIPHLDLLSKWLLIHAVIKVNPCSKWGPELCTIESHLHYVTSLHGNKPWNVLWLNELHVFYLYDQTSYICSCLWLNNLYAFYSMYFLYPISSFLWDNSPLKVIVICWL